jgi:hypothetical protein
MTATCRWIANLVVRIQNDYLEHPTLTLTLPAAQSRFELDEVTCAGVLGALVDARVLIKGAGAYRRHFPRTALRPHGSTQRQAQTTL